jgi:hypothetical protein
MKLTVSRQLSEGYYYVAFAVSDFTPDEVKKMESFGVPLINILQGGPPGARAAYKIQLTRVSPSYRASFPAEEDAKKYEEAVVMQIREAMKTIRERTDDFTSTAQVDV